GPTPEASGTLRESQQRWGQRLSWLAVTNSFRNSGVCFILLLPDRLGGRRKARTPGNGTKPIRLRQGESGGRHRRGGEAKRQPQGARCGVGQVETCESCLGFLRSLVARMLKGVRLVISDVH